jgi:hypothetical protein
MDKIYEHHGHISFLVVTRVKSHPEFTFLNYNACLELLSRTAYTNRIEYTV